MDGSKCSIVDRTRLVQLSGRLVLLTNPQHLALHCGCSTANASGGNACEVLGLNLAQNALRKNSRGELHIRSCTTSKSCLECHLGTYFVFAKITPSVGQLSDEDTRDSSVAS